jgi:type VI secretion system protein ImpH
LLVRFLGLLGPNGPLPLHLTEYARDRMRNEQDPTFARFLDLFHHRMLSLFFRAWADSEPTVNYDRPETDRFALYVGALFGLGMPALRDRDAMPDGAKLHYAGRLVCQTRHAEGLQHMLQDYFRMPARLEEFVGCWINLPANCLCRLGASRRTGSLGQTTTIGARVWDCQQHFRVVMGPMDYDRYRQFLPGGDSLRRLAAFVRNYVGDELGWDLQLILKKEQTPPPELSMGGCVGWTTWLHGRPPREDPDDLVLQPQPTE